MKVRYEHEELIYIYIYACHVLPQMIFLCIWEGETLIPSHEISLGGIEIPYFFFFFFIFNLRYLNWRLKSINLRILNFKKKLGETLIVCADNDHLFCFNWPQNMIFIFILVYLQIILITSYSRLHHLLSHSSSLSEISWIWRASFTSISWMCVLDHLCSWLFLLIMIVCSVLIDLSLRDQQFHDLISKFPLLKCLHLENWDLEIEILHLKISSSSMTW